MSKSNHTFLNLVEPQLTEALGLIQTDVCQPFPNESYGGSKYFFPIIDDFPLFSWVFFLEQQLDISIALQALFNDVDRQ
jgi:hypothetical protein